MDERQSEQRLTKEQLLDFVLECLKNKISNSESYRILSSNFPEYEPSYLFHTLVRQHAWVLVCSGRLSDATRLLESHGDSPGEVLRDMWRRTTRNSTRALLYDYLRKRSLLSAKDEEHHRILHNITTVYPNTSFSRALQLSKSLASRALDTATQHSPWGSLAALSSDGSGCGSFLFPELFPVPEEPPVDSPLYFSGSIALIESQSPKMLKLLQGRGSHVERLWLLHCQHQVTEMAQLFREELSAMSKLFRTPKLRCLKFVNLYYSHLDDYERETLLDILCDSGHFADEELKNFDLLLIRISKNKHLFDQQWWSKCTLTFSTFFREFSKYCGHNRLFMPFELFVLSHPKAKDVSLDDVSDPMIHFIWDLWVKRDLSSAAHSCMQLVSGRADADPTALWDSLPRDSLAPLASLVWNRDPTKFRARSPEVDSLSARLRESYPLLSSLVRGEIPHPSAPLSATPPPREWRSPVFTSKCDLEVHDVISAHFSQFDFSKVLTGFYGRTPGQPPHPHFDHPSLVVSPQEPLYFYYVKALLPVSAFQQALDDSIDEAAFKDICANCVHESFKNKQIRLSVLTFIELVDFKFGTDKSIDYKLVVTIFDYLSSNSVSNETINELMNIYNENSQSSANSIQNKLNARETDQFLLVALLRVRCGLPLDYSPITALSRANRPAQLLLFIDRAEEVGAFYSARDVSSIVRTEMPANALKDHLLFHLTQSLPHAGGESPDVDHPALVVFNAISSSTQPQHVSLLQEALKRRDKLYSILAFSIDGSDRSICALVTLLTMRASPVSISTTGTGIEFDFRNPPNRTETTKLFMDVLQELLLSNKSSEVLTALEHFSETSVATNIANWYHSVEIFAFKRAQISLNKINDVLDETIEDDLLGTFYHEYLNGIIFPLQESLAQICSQKSQVHLFRYLQLLSATHVSPSLDPRVRLAKVIEDVEDIRQGIMRTDLLGDYGRIVTDLTQHHSLLLGQRAAECLGISSASVTSAWLRHQYSTASTPDELLRAHRRTASAIHSADPCFYISLFSVLLSYSQPSSLTELLEFALKHIGDDMKDLQSNVEALLIHIQISVILNKRVPEDRGSKPSVSKVLGVLFPSIVNVNDIVREIDVNLNTPILYSSDSLQRFFDSTIDITINYCIDNLRITDARNMSRWRMRNPRIIVLLEAVQNVLDGMSLTPEQAQLVCEYGSPDDRDTFLREVARRNGDRFESIYLIYQSATKLKWDTVGLLSKRVVDILRSELPLDPDNWELVKEMIITSKISIEDSTTAIVDSFIEHSPNALTEDFGENFIEFTKLSGDSQMFSNILFAKTREMKESESLSSIIGNYLHSSLCASNVDGCSEVLNGYYDALSQSGSTDQILKIITIFPKPELMLRYIQYILTHDKLDLLLETKVTKDICHVIVSCCRHIKSNIDLHKLLSLTLDFRLYRDYGELQLECGDMLLTGTPSASDIQEASKHYLLALSYFLHEKCYSLSMRILKKLSLISL